MFKDVVDKFTLSSSRTWSQEERRESRTDEAIEEPGNKMHHMHSVHNRECSESSVSLEAACD